MSTNEKKHPQDYWIAVGISTRRIKKWTNHHCGWRRGNRVVELNYKVTVIFGMTVT